MFSWPNRALEGSVLVVPRSGASLSRFNWIFGERSKRIYHWSSIYIEAYWIIENGVDHTRRSKWEVIVLQDADGFSGRQRMALSIASSHIRKAIQSSLIYAGCNMSCDPSLD